jgi:hypothetical protein
MKKMRILLVVSLLVASTTLMAKPSARSFEKAVAIRQTEQLAKSLDLNKKQVNKILAINQKYAKKYAQLNGKHMKLQGKGLLDASAQRTFFEALSVSRNARTQKIKSVLTGEQLIAYAWMSLMDESAQETFFEAVSVSRNARTQEFEPVLNRAQLIAYESLLPIQEMQH